MSSEGYTRPLILEVRPSLYAQYFVYAMHAVAAIVIMYLPVAMVWRLLLLVYAMMSCWYTIGRIRCPVKLVWQADGDWLIAYPGQAPCIARLHHTTSLLPRVVALTLRVCDRRKTYSFLLLQDTLPATSLRQLRVRLKIDASRRTGKTLLEEMKQ